MGQIKYLPIPVAVEIETGIRPHPVTCWRWSTEGRGGVVLQTWMLGGRRMTTRDAVRQFIERRTEATPATKRTAHPAMVGN